MSDCCSNETLNAEAVDSGQRRTILIVLAINVLLFMIELGAGLWADSQALIADSADNLGDALVYLLSFMVIGHSLRWRSGAALVKGIIQLGFGLAIMVSIGASILGQPEPVGTVMIVVAIVALIANLACFGLLMRHRHRDINMRSVWLCSRNDIINNAGVILSGILVVLTGSYWPDIIVAAIVGIIFLHTSWTVVSESIKNLRSRP